MSIKKPGVAVGRAGQGHVSRVEEFEGLILRRDDIDALSRMIELAYEAFKQKSGE